MYLKPDKARDYWCPGEIIQIDVQITYANVSGLKRLSFEDIKDGFYDPGEVHSITLKKDEPVLFTVAPFDKCVKLGRFKYLYLDRSGKKVEDLFLSIGNETFMREPYEVYNAPKFGKILPSLILHEGITNCVITFI